jgi:cystathionine beta-lyase
MSSCILQQNILAGHSDVIAGALIAKTAELENAHFQQFATGAYT